MTPGFGPTRKEKPYLPYPEKDRVIINAHNFTPPPPASIGFGDELLILRGPTGVTDQSGNGNDGSYNGGMGTVSDTGSGGTVAFSFDGSNDFINFASAIVTAAPISLACWIKPSTVAAGQRTMMSITDSAGTANQFYLRQNATTLQTVTNATGGASTASITSILTAGAWQFVIGEFVSTTQRRSIHDGTPGSAASSGPRVPSVNIATVGWGYGAGQGYFNGLIDDIRIFDRVLTPTEIADWYAAGRGYDA